MLERLRAALPRDPLLVVPTAADVEHYQRELAASGFVFGAEVLTFARPDRARSPAAPGCAARPLGPRRARPRRARRDRATSRCARSPRSAATPGFADAAGALFAELQRSLVTPARFTAALRAWAAEQRPRAAYAERARGALLGLPPPARAARAARPGGLRVGGARRAARRARRVGRRGPCSSTASTTSRRPSATRSRRSCATPRPTCCVALPVRAGPRRVRRPRGDGRGAAPARRRGRCTCPSAPSTTPPPRAPALHHLERALFEPGAERVPPNGAVRLLEAGGERAEAELVGAEVLELMRQGIEPRDIAVLLRGDAGDGRAVRPGARGLRHPGQRTTAACRSRRTRLGAGVLAGARAALPGGAAADLLTWLRTPGRLADPARRRRARGARAARRAAHARARPARAWEAQLGGAPLAALDALRRGRGGGRRGAARARSRPRPRRSGPRRTAAAPRCSAPRTAPTRASPPTCARPPPSCARSRPPTRRCSAARTTSSTRSAPSRSRRGGPRSDAAERLGRRPAAPRPRRRAARRPARDPRAPLPRGLRLRAPGRRVPAPARRRSRSSPTRTAAASPAPPGCGCRCTRTCSTASGRCSTPRSRGPRTCCSSPGARPTRRATRSRRRAFLDDVRALFTDELWEQRGTRLLADVTWAPRDAPTPHELRRAYAAAQPAPEPPPLGAPATRRGARRCSPRARPSPRAGSSRSPPAACAGWSSSCCGPSAPSPTRSRCAAARSRTRVLERTLELLRERTGSARDHAGAARRRARGAARRARRARARGAARRPPPRAAARPRGRPRALPAHRGRVRRRLRADARSSGRSAAPDDARRPLALGGGGGCVTGRVDRVDVGPGGAAIVRDYKGRTVVGGAKWADEHAAPGRALPARGARAARPRAGRRALPAARRAASSARAGSSATTCPAPTRAPTSSTRDAFERRARGTRASSPRGPPRDLHAGPDRARAPSAARAAAAATRRSAARASRRRSRRREPHDAASSARRSPTAAGRRCSPPARARARPR